MKKAAGRNTGRWVGISISAALAGAGLVILRHILETPQPLKSTLPGEAHLYRWQQHSIFYKVLGAADAPPLVLLHRPDIGSSGHEMQSIMASLAQHYRVYTPDLLGFGLSDRPAAEYSAALYNKLCQDFLREVVQKPATLVASGLSCNYAVSAATAAPALCTSLVLISPLKLQGDSQPVPLRGLIEKPLLRTLLYPFLSTRLAFLLTYQLEGRDDFKQFSANTHQLGAEYAAMAQLAGKLTENVERQFERLQQPVLIIWGIHALNKRRFVTRLHRTALLANPTGEVRKVEFIREAALAAHKDQPDSVAAVIRRWQDEILAHKQLPAEHTPDILLQTIKPPTPYTSVVPRTPDPIAAPTSTATNHLAAPSAQAGRAVDTDEESAEILAYCVKCKQKRRMLQAREIFMKNGRPAMQGVCAVCGTRLNRIGKRSSEFFGNP